MIFYTYSDRFDRKVSSSKRSPKEVFTDCGKSIGDTYEYRTKDGIKSLVRAGEVNRQELIDSFADDCDIVKKIQKFIAGDLDIMNPESGVYGDFTNTPKTYAEMFERLQMCKNVFDQMPAKVKNEFGNSVEKFWSEFGSDYFNDVFAKFGSDSKDIDIDKVEIKEKADAE